MISQPGSYLTQSKFYSPSFNAAIFDGPIRIYFAQVQEPTALKLYFHLQNSLKELCAQTRSLFRNHGKNVFVMIYPSVETFSLSFQTATNQEVLDEAFGKDHVIGLCGSPEPSDFSKTIGLFEKIIREWSPDRAPEAAL